MILNLKLTAPATLIDVRRLAEAVSSFGRTMGMPAEQLFEMELAVVEAANNIVAHGDVTQPADYIALYMPDPAHCSDTMVVELHCEGAAVSVVIPEANAMAPLDAESGRGMPLIEQCVDEFRYERRGNHNVWHLKKQLNAPDT